jgi:hypothetical protein
VFSWLKAIFRQDTSHRSKFDVPPARLEDLLKAPGRAPSAHLLALANSSSQEAFVDIVCYPSLVGSAIRDGAIGQPSRDRVGTTSFQTFVFTSAETHALVQGQSIEQSIFMLRKDVMGQSSTNYTQFLVGRSKEADVRIVDFAISRQHALIRISTDGFTIYDCNSRNGTKVNGKAVYATPIPLRDRDVVTFGRYDFTFLLPNSLYHALRKPPQVP